MPKRPKPMKTGIENLKIIPDPDLTIIQVEGGKMYSWTYIMELTDEERDKLIDILLKVKKGQELIKERKAAAKKSSGKREKTPDLLRMAQARADKSREKK